MATQGGVHQFLKVTRANFKCAEMVRCVYMSELVRVANGNQLERYIADRAPFFYRDLPSITQSLGDGFFVSTIKQTLSKLPTSESFRESHFGEIAAGIFAEEVMGLTKLYSKLSLLTAENANAYKMDLVLFDLTLIPLSSSLAKRSPARRPSQTACQQSITSHVSRTCSAHSAAIRRTI